MKKILSMAMMIAMVAVTSCTKDVSEGVSSEEATLAVTVELPADVVTRATEAGDPTLEDMRLYVAVSYNGLLVSSELANSEDFTNGASYTTDFRLVTGQDYVVSAWADFGGKYYERAFVIGEVPSVTMSQTRYTTSTNFDAYFGFEAVNLTKSGTTTELTLTRPFGRVSVNTTDLQEAAMDNAGLTSGSFVRSSSVSLPTTISLVDGSLSNPAAFKVDGDCIDDLLSYEYIFAVDNATLYDFEYTYTVVDATGAKVVDVPYTFTNIPVRRNYKTNISGSILTTDGDVTVTLDQDWAGITYVNITDAN